MQATAADDARKAAGKALAAARRETGRTQVDVADAAGLDQQTISRIERGGPASLNTLLAVAHALDVNLFEVLQ